MAQNVDFTIPALSAPTEYPNSFQRQGAFPLDKYSVFSSLTDAQNYVKGLASCGNIGYIGQTIVVAIPGSKWILDYAVGCSEPYYTNGKWCCDIDGADTIDLLNEDGAAETNLYCTNLYWKPESEIESIYIRTTAPSVKLYVIGPENELIEQATISQINNASGNFEEAIRTAIQSLDSSVSASTASNDDVNVLTGITETDGKLTSKTEVLLKKVAKTAAAADMSIADTNNRITATTVEGALDEIAKNVSDLTDDSKVTMTEESGTGNILKVYKFYQGGTTTGTTNTGGTLIGTINTMKDLVVTNGSVITVATADKAIDSSLNVGEKAIKLQIANQTNPIYIPVNSLYKDHSGSVGTEVTIAIDANNQITATINKIASSKIDYENNETVYDALSRLDGADSVDGSVSKKIKDAIDALDTPAGGVSSTAPSAASGNGSANKISVVTQVTVEESNGVVSSVSTQTTDVATPEAVSSAKSELIGTASDTKDANTIAGAKKYADSVIANKNVDAVGDDYVTASAANNKVTVSTNTASKTDITNKTANKLATAVSVNEYVKDVVEGLDSSASSHETAPVATGSGSANKVAAAVAVTVSEEDGKISSVQVNTVDVATPAAVTSAKTELIGNANDAKTVSTIYGAKAYADDAAKTQAEKKVQFRGTTTSNISSSGDFKNSKSIKINNVSTECNVGDVAVYNGDEYRLNQTGTSPDTYEWKKTGDTSGIADLASRLSTVESNYVPKSRKISGVDLHDDITKAELQTALNVADGAQVNVIETVKVGGTTLTVTNKAVDIDNLILDGGSATQDIA